MVARFLSMFVLAVCLFQADTAGAGAIKKKVTLVLVCDIYNMSANRDKRGGMARITAAVKAERAKGHPVLVAHAGDAISPSLMSGLDRGEHMIALINMMAPDIFTPGNHEYDFGPEVFRKRMKQATFPVLAANLKDENGKPMAGILSHKLYELDGVKIGVIGLTADDSPVKSSPGKLRFSSSVDAATRLSYVLRKQGADLVVVVAHADRKRDEALIASKAADIILSGDDHDLQVRYDGQRAFVEAMEDGLYVAAIDLDIAIKEKNGRRKVKWWPNFRLIDTATLTPDAAVAKKVAAYQALLSKQLDVGIGVTKTELDSRNAAVRGGEAAIGNLIADALRETTGADIGFQNGGGIRGKKVYAAGSTISRRDVLKELPFGNKVYVLAVTGRQLKLALESAFSRADELTGRFPQVSGLTVRADLSRPVGKRVVSILVNGSKIDPTGVYKVATNDYLAGGGDGFSVFKKTKILVGPTDGKLLANHVMVYLKKHKSVAAKIEGRVIVARSKSAE